MPGVKISRMVWSPEDEAAFKKWRRALCAFYACIGLILVAAWSLHQLVRDGRSDSASIASSSASPSAGIAPAGTAR